MWERLMIIFMPPRPARTSATTTVKGAQAHWPSISSRPRTNSLQRLYVLFFIELGSRRVHPAGCTRIRTRHGSFSKPANCRALAERAEPPRFLIRDRDQKFTAY